MTERVQISIREGPVTLLNVPATGAMKTHLLWNGTTASESFPPGVQPYSAFYNVTLEKPVTHAHEVRPVEQELIKVLLLIAAAWSFSGGSYMVINSRQVISSPVFNSNADEIEQNLLALERIIKHQFADSRVVVDTIGTYRCPPMFYAAEIARTMRADPVTHRVVTYYHESCIHRPNRDEASWFVNLYKVRDALTKHYHGAQPAQTALCIPEPDWTKLGKLLNNNDLRHAEMTGKAPSVSFAEVDDAYSITRQWVVAFLQSKGLTVF
jgi:hypothetical protein